MKQYSMQRTLATMGLHAVTVAGGAVGVAVSGTTMWAVVVGGWALLHVLIEGALSTADERVRLWVAPSTIPGLAHHFAAIASATAAAMHLCLLDQSVPWGPELACALLVVDLTRAVLLSYVYLPFTATRKTRMLVVHMSPLLLLLPSLFSVGGLSALLAWSTHAHLGAAYSVASAVALVLHLVCVIYACVHLRTGVVVL